MTQPHPAAFASLQGSRQLIELLSSLPRHQMIRLRHDPLDLLPIEFDVQVHAEPAANADVRRPKVQLRLRFDHRLLRTRRCRAPEGKPSTVVVIRVHDEAALALEEPSRLPVTQPLLDGWVAHADGPELVKGTFHLLIMTLHTFTQT